MAFLSGFVLLFRVFFIVLKVVDKRIRFLMFNTEIYLQFFGFCAMVVYGYDAWLKFKAAKSGALAQGQHTPKHVSAVTSPAY